MKRTGLFLIGLMTLAVGCSSSDESSNAGGSSGSGGADAGGSGGADASAGSGGTAGTGGSSGSGGGGGTAGTAGAAGSGASAGSAGSAGTAGAAGASGSAGAAGSSGSAGAAGSAGSGGSVDAGPDGSAGAAPDAAPEASGPEICDGVDNDQNGQVDEGCDDDGDDYCDANMVFAGSSSACPNGGYDCDDGNVDIHPDATTHMEGVDYDCDGKLEYMAEIVISVDDLLTRLCVNGADISSFGPYAGQWPYADTYHVVLESGDNVVGVSGRDTGLAISAFVATIKVNNTTYITDGVNPPANGIAYTPASPEWNQTKWRYYPTEVGTPDVSWCDVTFDDSAWGPAIIAKSTNCAADPDLGDLGHCPWIYDCGGGETRCPSDFKPYYDDTVPNNEPVWVWDYNPVNLADAWFRHHITLP